MFYSQLNQKKMKKRNFFIAFALIFMSIALFTTCDECTCDEDGSSGDSSGLENYFSVQDGTLNTGSMPSGSASLGTVSYNSSAIAGGTAYASISTTVSITEIYVGVRGVNAYYTVRASSSSGGYAFMVLYSQHLSQSFNIQISARLSNGSITSFYSSAVEYIEAGTGGTGGLQISLSFDNDKDVDLYVIQPDGTTIYYGNQGGYPTWGLDLDSNAGCTLDHVRNENVFYPRANLKSGKYEVYVNMYGNCDPTTATNWVVKATRDGSPVPVSFGRNPASGTFAAGTANNMITTPLNDKAIKVMEFTITGTSSAELRSTTPPSESAIRKMAQAVK
jgi:hypothetical protein